MERLNNSKLLKYSDKNYEHAVNFQTWLYNFPITLNIGEKHSRKKYILNAGTSDTIDLYKEGVYVYVLSENFGLSYISLMIINTETGATESVFLNESDCCNDESTAYGILEMESIEQIKILSYYLN